jgi:hypothetical protein
MSLIFTARFNPYCTVIVIIFFLGEIHGNKLYTTLSNGYLGSHIDEERSELRYVMRIAEFSESSNL